VSTPLSQHEHTRLLELLADAQFDGLTPDERGELEALKERAGGAPEMEALLGDLVRGFDEAAQAAPGSGGDSAVPSELPAALRDRLIKRGKDSMKAPLVGAPVVTGRPVESNARASGADAGGAVAGRLPGKSGRSVGIALAAGLAIAAGVGAAAYFILQNQQQQTQRTEQLLAEAERELEAARERVAMLEARAEDNRVVLAEARQRAEELRARLESTDESLRARDTELARLAEREVELATQLAQATENLTAAELTIARYEAPADPAELAANRRKLLEVPGTVRLAWSPFDLPDAPAEQRQVTGDVIWNDDLQTGYLRFVGLDVNDPLIEQYQVWVIDERGMEQKVSGGVFNATAEGEVIVPIDPGIPVGRVALFAITVENPGGTWVPDLRRRVVVAPRDQG